jgi:hypothetical protein
MPRALRFRMASRQPLHLSLMFGSAVRALKAQHIGPDTGQSGVVDIKLKINRLSGLTAPTSETTHRVAREPQKNRAASSQCLVDFIARATCGPNKLRDTGAAPPRRLSLSKVSMWRCSVDVKPAMLMASPPMR